MDLGTSCRPWPLECVCWACCYGSTGSSPLFVSFVCPTGSFFVSFILPLSFGFVISLGIYIPVGSAGIGGHCWWIRDYHEVALPLSMLWWIFFVVFFFLLLQLATGS